MANDGENLSKPGFEETYEPVSALTIRRQCDPLEVLTAEQAAALIGCTVHTLYRIPDHKLRRYQAGSEMRIFRRDALLYLVTYGRSRSQALLKSTDKSRADNGESVSDVINSRRGGVGERSQSQRRTQ